MPRTEESLRPLWKHSSGLVLRARCEQRAASSNEALTHFVKEDPSGPLAPLMLSWIADNFVFDKSFEEAIGAYERLLKRHGKKRFRGLPWGVHALEQMANCHASLGRSERAVRISRLRSRCQIMTPTPGCTSALRRFWRKISKIATRSEPIGA